MRAESGGHVTTRGCPTCHMKGLSTCSLCAGSGRLAVTAQIPHLPQDSRDFATDTVRMTMEMLSHVAPKELIHMAYGQHLHATIKRLAAKQEASERRLEDQFLAAGLLLLGLVLWLVTLACWLVVVL